MLGFPAEPVIGKLREVFPKGNKFVEPSIKDLARMQSLVMDPVLLEQALMMQKSCLGGAVELVAQGVKAL